MPQVTFIEHNGTAHTVEAIIGKTLMEAAVDNAGPGIDADCGGACACATCHVFVDADWEAKTGARTEAEVAMLNFAAEVMPNSRLSCQIPITAELDGLVVHMPDGQH
jgi:2Fe-2S ferredoxin